MGRTGIFVRCRTEEECRELRRLLEKARRKVSFETGVPVGLLTYRDVLTHVLRQYIGEDVVTD